MSHHDILTHHLLFSCSSGHLPNHRRPVDSQCPGHGLGCGIPPLWHCCGVSEWRADRKCFKGTPAQVQIGQAGHLHYLEADSDRQQGTRLRVHNDQEQSPALADRLHWSVPDPLAGSQWHSSHTSGQCALSLGHLEAVYRFAEVGLDQVDWRVQLHRAPFDRADQPQWGRAQRQPGGMASALSSTGPAWVLSPQHHLPASVLVLGHVQPEWSAKWSKDSGHCKQDAEDGQPSAVAVGDATEHWNNPQGSVEGTHRGEFCSELWPACFGYGSAVQYDGQREVCVESGECYLRDSEQWLSV